MFTPSVAGITYKAAGLVCTIRSATEARLGAILWQSRAGTDVGVARLLYNERFSLQSRGESCCDE